jgi:hypothetical protein
MAIAVARHRQIVGDRNRVDGLDKRTFDRGTKCYRQIMSDDELRAPVLREAHRLIDGAANAAIARIRRIGDGFADSDTVGLTYPPGDGTSDNHLLTDEERKALVAVARSEVAVGAFRKLLRDAGASALFHFLCLLDGVGDPQGWEGDVWLGVDLVAPQEDAHREMLHDEFYERYWEYINPKRGS